MQHTRNLRCALALGVCAAAIATAAPAFAQQRATASAAAVGTIEELIVTAQRREQSIQSVPIAVSAFSNEALKEQRIDGGQDLLLAVPKRDLLARQLRRLQLPDPRYRHQADRLQRRCRDRRA
jgi:outer membrane receptor protein involved in Fe transport